jgi:hypothetical protein
MLLQLRGIYIFLSWSLCYCGDVSKNIDCSCTQLFLTWPRGWGWHSCLSEWHGRLEWAWHCVSESTTCLWVSLAMLCRWAGTAGWASLEQLGGWAWHSWVSELGTAVWVSEYSSLGDPGPVGSVSPALTCGWGWHSWVSSGLGTAAWVSLEQLGGWFWHSCISEPRCTLCGRTWHSWVVLSVALLCAVEPGAPWLSLVLLCGWPGTAVWVSLA